MIKHFHILNGKIIWLIWFRETCEQQEFDCRHQQRCHFPETIFFSLLHLIATQKFKHNMHTFVMWPNNTYHVDTKIHDALFDWWPKKRFHLHSLFLLFRPPAKSQSQGRGWWRPKISFPFLLFSWELLLIFPISLLSQELSTLGTYSKTWVTENFVKSSFHSWSFKVGFASQGFQLLLTISEERLRDSPKLV